MEKLIYRRDFGLDDWIYWYPNRNYRQLQRHRWSRHSTIHRYIHNTVLSLLHSPLVVSWQRIHNSLTVTSNHTWSVLCTA
jgi:hypothetical protein